MANNNQQTASESIASSSPLPFARAQARTTMATTSSQAAPATTTANSSGTASNTSEAIVGSHVFTINGFSATKDLEAGKCIKSSIFRVGGHGWYINCYPCGVDKESNRWVTLFLCRQQYHRGSRVSGECRFTLMESLKDGCFKELFGHSAESFEYEFEGNDCFKDWQAGVDFIEREVLESLLKDDCFHVRCIVLVDKFPAVPLPDLATETMAGSYLLTVEDYSKTRRAFFTGEDINSRYFRVGEHNWYVYFYPCGEDKKDAITVNLCLDDPDCKDEVKVRFEITLLTHDGRIISSRHDFCTFSHRIKAHGCNFLTQMEHESLPFLQDCIHIRCDMAVVKEITVVQAPPERPDLHRHFGDLLASKVGSDVTVEVGGDLFSVHKCVLASRSTVFMAKFFEPAGKEITGVPQVLRIDDMEPRVFKALLHFIYTDALPEICEEDKVMMAQGLLVAADRYAMERLKLICGDMLCSYIDATTAVATQELAEKHGCLKLKVACINFIKDWLAKVTP